MTMDAKLRDRLKQAAFLLRSWAGDRQRAANKWTTQEQAAIDCAIDLEAAARKDQDYDDAVRQRSDYNER